MKLIWFLMLILCTFTTHALGIGVSPHIVQLDMYNQGSIKIMNPNPFSVNYQIKDNEELIADGSLNALESEIRFLEFNIHKPLALQLAFIPENQNLAFPALVFTLLPYKKSPNITIGLGIAAAILLLGCLALTYLFYF